jgi:hypothetical protein
MLPASIVARGAALVLGVLLLTGLAPSVPAIQTPFPASQSDRDFWALTGQLSEPDGYFRSNSGSPDNLLSNESAISVMAAALAERVKPGGVYLGVGPEQNFTYIAAMRARIAFITDIRRGNLHLHLLYKALFETSGDRVEFVSRLFGRRAVTFEATPSANALMNAYLRAEPVSDAVFQANLAAVSAYLTKTRRLPIPAEDLAGIEYVYRHFYQFGPAIDYGSSVRGTSGSTGSYARIQSAVDSQGRERTFLATDESFRFIKDLQSRNLIVPVVGDFAGPTALRAIGAFVRDRGATVGAFYVSNVEQYLQRAGVWTSFCANVATMPLDPASVFIRPSGRAGTLASMSAETAGCR